MLLHLVASIFFYTQISVDALVTFLSEFNSHIYNMVISNGANEKKGAIYALSKFSKCMGKFRNSFAYQIAMNGFTPV